MVYRLNGLNYEKAKITEIFDDWIENNNGKFKKAKCCFTKDKNGSVHFDRLKDTYLSPAFALKAIKEAKKAYDCYHLGGV